MNKNLFDQLSLSPGSKVRVSQGKGQAVIAAAMDDRLPDDCVRVAAGHPSTAALGAMFGAVTLERVAAEKAA